jgi:hypothetical protein
MPDTPPPPESDPQIKQDVTGDRNQSIGQAIDSTIVQFSGDGQVVNLTIHERVPESSVPTPINIVQDLTQQEYRYRQCLLNNVKEIWVKGVLERSLHNRVLIELGLQERLDLLKRPFRNVAEFPDAPGEFFAEGTQIATVFEQMGVGRTLLILGEPGSGKTITLTKLAEDLIARTEPDLRQPIPVVFNLSSWASKPQTIKKWLVQELSDQYKVPKILGKAWIEKENLILLLDGLDEVKAEQRTACVQALNQFMQTHGTTELTICCRIRDYQELKERLLLRSAICIQPLSPRHINSYLELAGEQLSSLKILLLRDTVLQGFATSPLMLSIMSLAYQGCGLEEVELGGTTENYRKRLFDAYIDRMFVRRETTQQYPRKETQRWLIWLAKRMTNASLTTFYIERLQPSWLASEGKGLCYRWKSSLISVLMYGLIYGLSAGLIVGLSAGLSAGLIFGRIGGLIVGLFAGLRAGLIFGLIAGLISEFQGDIKPFETLRWSWLEAKHGLRSGLILGLIAGLIAGLIGGLIVGLSGGLSAGLSGGLSAGLSGGLSAGLSGGLSAGLSAGLIGGLLAGPIFGLIGGLISEFQGDIKPFETLRRSWLEAKHGLRTGLIGSLTLGLIGSLTLGLIGSLTLGLIGRPIVGLSGGLIVGLISGLIVGPIFGLIGELIGGLIAGLIGGFRGSEVQQKINPNQSIFISARNAAIFGIPVFVISGLSTGLLKGLFAGLLAGLFFGLTFGLIGGGNACLRHFKLRLTLYNYKLAPWNYARFLDYATERLFLQKVGGGYIFVHRMLLEHFAEMPLEQKQR